MLKNRNKDSLRATRWIDMEPEGVGSKGWMQFALEEAQKAKLWVWEYVKEHTLPDGDVAWQAAQLRRKYLAGKLALHTVPGVIFEYAILEALYTQEEGKAEGWDSVFLPVRSGWVGERGQDAPATQKFSFSGKVREVVRGDTDGRLITPEKAEAQLFDESTLAWKWGSLYIKGNVEKAVRSALHHWHIAWRGRANFFHLVKVIEVRKAEEGWQLRFLFK